MTEHYSSSVPFADAAGVYVLLTAIVTVAFFIYQTIKPIKLDGDLPCPESQFLFGFLPYFTRHHHQWPTETTRLANLYKKEPGQEQFPAYPALLCLLRFFSFLRKQT